MPRIPWFDKSPSFLTFTIEALHLLLPEERAVIASWATLSKSQLRSAVNGRGMAFSARICLPFTDTIKFPFPGFSGLTETDTPAFRAFMFSASFLDERPNTPQDLHASITTSPAATAAVSLGEISSLFLFGPILILENVEVERMHVKIKSSSNTTKFDVDGFDGSASESDAQRPAMRLLSIRISSQRPF